MRRLCIAQVMPLRDAAEEDNARAALRSLGAALAEKSLLAPVSLELQGLSDFRHQATPPAIQQSIRHAGCHTPAHLNVLKPQLDPTFGDVMQIACQVDAASSAQCRGLRTCVAD